jgi:hypothetical protein
MVISILSIGVGVGIVVYIINLFIIKTLELIDAETWRD